jgi:L-ascorbate metabolism protein UlaG (beta-lactamase superfamily)
MLIVVRVIALFFLLGGWASAQQVLKRLPSTCFAVAQNLHGPDIPVRFASFSLAAAESKYEVILSYQGHSTYLLESPDGVKVATDFAGWMTDPVTPDVVTMNQAHSSHYTDYPDAAIKTVLKGWGDDGAIAEHHLMVGDVVIRNVTTDILRFSAVPDGNSIFIFEVAGLCIGHLGHLHHKLSEDHYTKIGRLDVVMIAVDGGLTMSHLSAREILKRLRSSVVLPMHVRSYDALPQFLNYLGEEFAIERLRENRLVLSLRTLPKRPTVMLLPGVASYSSPEE